MWFSNESQKVPQPILRRLYEPYRASQGYLNGICKHIHNQNPTQPKISIL